MDTIKEFFSAAWQNHKWFVVVIGLLMMTNLYVFISKKLENKKHSKELVSTQKEYEAQAKLLIDKNAKEQLTLMLKTFVWAVRSSMIRSNMDEVDQYFTELIKEENIHEIVLVGKNGNILVSTNKKHQSKSFGNFYPSQILAEEDIFFASSKDGKEYHVAAPVLSLNNRLGTLFLVYATDSFTLETKPLAAITKEMQPTELDTLAVKPIQPTKDTSEKIITAQ